MTSPTIDALATHQPLTNCPSCHGAVDVDQRYCLNCGSRQRAARMPATTPAPEAGRSASTGLGEGPVGVPVKDWTPVLGLGGLAALAVMFTIGVLIGSRGDGQKAASGPQVVTVQGSGTSSAGTGAGNGTQQGARRKAARATGGSAHVAGGTPVSAAQQRAGAAVINQLSSCSGSQCSKVARKITQPVATPGKPPPVDRQAPGGGSGGGQTFK